MWHQTTITQRPLSSWRHYCRICNQPEATLVWYFWLRLKTAGSERQPCSWVVKWKKFNTNNTAKIVLWSLKSFSWSLTGLYLPFLWVYQRESNKRLLLWLFWLKNLILYRILTVVFFYYSRRLRLFGCHVNDVVLHDLFLRDCF